MDAPLVAILQGKWTGIILHRFHTCSGAGRLDLVPNTRLASAADRRGRPVDWGNWDNCWLPPLPRPSLVAIESDSRISTDILYYIQRVRRTHDVGRKSPPAPRES